MTLKPLPAKPTAEQSAVYVSRILGAYNAATDAQMATGRDWYPAAHRIAQECPLGSYAGSGVIAALSPMTPWSLNIELARDAFTGHVHGTFGDALRKVRAILAGVDPQTVLPMDAKTGQFFLCIADPSDPYAVAVDRHAHDIAAGMKYGADDRGLTAPGRYRSIADAYRSAAKVAGIAPCKLQAITWTVAVDRHRGNRALKGVQS